jgi:hypothetical protein
MPRGDNYSIGRLLGPSSSHALVHPKSNRLLVQGLILRCARYFLSFPANRYLIAALAVPTLLEVLRVVYYLATLLYFHVPTIDKN